MSQSQAHGRRLVGDARRPVALKVAADYEAGKSVREIAKAHKRSYGFVYGLLVDARVTMRPRGGPRKKPLFPAIVPQPGPALAA